ncbi:hypothetical protein ACVWZR_006870 [Bradyrhizobium sp. i1.3.1]
MGGPAPFGLERQVVGDESKRKGSLRAGERKFLATDRVKLAPGVKEQVEVVRWIFDEYLRGTSQREIARELNRCEFPTNGGGPWCRTSINTLLRQEAYIGTAIYNRGTKKLGAKRTQNPKELWVRREGAIEAIVDRDVFVGTSKALEQRCVRITKKEMLVRLRRWPGRECKACKLEHLNKTGPSLNAEDRAAAVAVLKRRSRTFSLGSWSTSTHIIRPEPVIRNLTRFAESVLPARGSACFGERSRTAVLNNTNGFYPTSQHIFRGTIRMGLSAYSDRSPPETHIQKEAIRHQAHQRAHEGVCLEFYKQNPTTAYGEVDSPWSLDAPIGHDTNTKLVDTVSEGLW